MLAVWVGVLCDREWRELVRELPRGLSGIIVDGLSGIIVNGVHGLRSWLLLVRIRIAIVWIVSSWVVLFLRGRDELHELRGGLLRARDREHVLLRGR